MSERERRRCLEVLELPQTANDEDIKRAYRSLAKQHHPDKNGGENATEKFQEISCAYKYLVEGPQSVEHCGESSFEGGIPIEILIRLFPWLFTGRPMFHEQPRFYRSSPFFMYDSSDDDDCYDLYDMDDGDNYFGCQRQTFPQNSTANSKNVNAKKERKKEKKKRYDERRKQEKKGENGQQASCGQESGENRKDTPSGLFGFKPEGKENNLPPDVNDTKEQKPADVEQTKQRASSTTNTQDKTSSNPNPSKPTDVKKSVAETIATSFNSTSQNGSERFSQNKDKKKKIQAEERKREKEILEIRRDLERQEEVKVKKLALKKEQEKRAAEERQRKEAEEQEREMERQEMERKEKERKELERKEMEKKERERKEMEKKEMDRTEHERWLALEREEMERLQRDTSRLDKKVKKTKQVRPLKKFPNGNYYSVLADVDPDDSIPQQTGKQDVGYPKMPCAMKQNFEATEEPKKRNENNKQGKTTSIMTMDDLDDISDNEDLLQYVSKTSFWCDPAVGSPNAPRNTSTASKQGNGAKNQARRETLPEKEAIPMQEKKRIHSRVFESSRYNQNTSNMSGAGVAPTDVQPGFNIPQTTASNRVHCWADEMDDVDDGAISGSSMNNSNVYKQPEANRGGYNYDASKPMSSHSASANANRNNSNASQGYSGNNSGAFSGNRGAFRGNRGASWGNRGAARGNRGASPGYGANNRSPSQGFGANNGSPSGYGANNRSSPQGFGANNGSPSGYGANNRSPPQGFGANNGSPQNYAGNKVFHNQQQGFYSGTPLQFSHERGYRNQTFHSNPWQPYSGPPPYGLYSRPFPNSFPYY